MYLKEIANIRTGLVLSRKKAALSDEVKVQYKQITLKSFSTSIKLQKEYFDDFDSVEKVDSTYISRAGDILVRLREPNVAVHIDEESAGLVIPSLMSIVRVDDDRVNSEFLAYYLNSTTIKRALKDKIKGTTIPMIKTKDLEDLDVILPPLEEQKRVVEFLKLSQREAELLDELRKQKEQFGQAILDTIITRNRGNR